MKLWDYTCLAMGCGMVAAAVFVLLLAFGIVIEGYPNVPW